MRVRAADSLRLVAQIRPPRADRAGEADAPDSLVPLLPYTPTLEGILDRRQHLVVNPAALPQRQNHFAVNHIAGAYRFGRVRNVVNRVFVVGRAPVPLQTLRRDACTHRAAERHTLSQPTVIAVQQRMPDRNEDCESAKNVKWT